VASSPHPLALSDVLDALRAAGFEGVFLPRATSPGVVELEHNARRESTLHVQTDLFDACRALEGAGYEAFELGFTIIVTAAEAGDRASPARAGLAKAGELEEGPGLAKAGELEDEVEEGPGLAKVSDGDVDLDEGRPSLAKAGGVDSWRSFRVA
jgi:hypothetical protein